MIYKLHTDTYNAADDLIMYCECPRSDGAYSIMLAVLEQVAVDYGAERAQQMVNAALQAAMRSYGDLGVTE